MNIYEQNYWSVYVNFLEDFQDLKYKGYSIPYLCHYASLIRSNKRLVAKLHNKKFFESLNVKVYDSKEVQEKFNDFINAHKKERKVKTTGKVVIHDVYNLLRFPIQIKRNLFTKDNSLFLIESTKSKPKNKPKNKQENKQKIKQRNKKSKQRYKQSKKISRPQKRRKKQKIKVSNGIKVKVKARSRSTLVNSNTNHASHHKTFNSYLPSFDQSTIKRMQIKATRIINTFPRNHLYHDKLFKKRFFAQISKIISRIEECNGLFEQEDVSAVIVPSTHYPESRTLVIVAAEKGIPTICMQHGIISSEFGYLPKIADVDGVYGQFEVDWFKSKGIDENGLSIIGHPRFDFLNRPPSMKKTDVIKALSLHPNKKNILVIVRGNNQLGMWKTFLDHIPFKKEANIIIRDFTTKPHSLTKSHPFTFSSRHIRLYDLIKASDVVVSYCSTVALEAMIAGKPVFIMNEQIPGYVGYYDGLKDLFHSSPATLSKTVNEYIKSKKNHKKYSEIKREFLAYAYPGGKLSNVRLMKLIRRLTS
ncbi:MAG: hypothetical protein WAM07_06115 [Halobacillus sp.]|uniref:hypothetical protein n=1 Tax=Halobacillus sp. TaxID=56800 RepID=UPI003BAF3AE0